MFTSSVEINGISFFWPISNFQLAIAKTASVCRHTHTLSLEASGWEGGKCKWVCVKLDTPHSAFRAIKFCWCWNKKHSLVLVPSLLAAQPFSEKQAAYPDHPEFLHGIRFGFRDLSGLQWGSVYTTSRSAPKRFLRMATTRLQTHEDS